MANKDEFVNSLWPAALEASQRTGVDPRIIVSQAALESNWGRSAPGNNYFGIKSHGQSGGNNLQTTEVINGNTVRVNDSFRAYGSPGESVAGYADFITKNPRYSNFRSAQGLDNQIAELGRSGYATDPNYANKIRSIASGLPGASPIGPDGSKGQEAYIANPRAQPSAPVIGSMAPQIAGPSPSAPAFVQQLAAGGGREPQDDSPSSYLSKIFGAMGSQQQTQDAPPPPANFQQNPQQANALLSLVQALKGRVI